MDGFEHIHRFLLRRLHCDYLRELFVHFLEYECLLRHVHPLILQVDICPFHLLPLVFELFPHGTDPVALEPDLFLSLPHLVLFPLQFLQFHLVLLECHPQSMLLRPYPLVLFAQFHADLFQVLHFRHRLHQRIVPVEVCVRQIREL